EVLDGAERALRAEQALLVHAAERWRADAPAEVVRPRVADGVGRRVRVPVRVTIEAGDAVARLHAAAVVRQVELLLRELGDEQAQALELLRVQNAVEEAEEVR